MKFLSFVLLAFVFTFAAFQGHDEPSRKIASEDDPAMVNALIDNRDAMLARKDVWMNPDADRIFMSTFEFEEDTIGMSQIKFAVEQARKGKRVDIVLDAAGHRLSDETLLYMVENDVNVHIFSPTFSLDGIKSRHSRLRQTWRGDFLGSLTAVWRQATYRMHDKILINFVSDLDSDGQVVLGGRNARDSHYGVDQRQITSTRSEGFGKAKKFDVVNPAFEYEHEVLLHNKKLHKEVTTYINDFLESEFTERIDKASLRAKMEKSKAHIAKYGDNWKSKLAADKVKFDDGFRAFSSDMQSWNNSYLKALENDSENQDYLAKRLTTIFTEHEGTIARLIDEKLISPKVLDRILTPIYGKTPSEIIRSLIYKKNKGEDIAGSVIAGLFKNFINKQPEVVAKNIKVRALKVATLDKILGPMAPDKSGFMMKKAQAMKTGISNSYHGGIGLDVNKYDNMERMLDQAIENWNEFGRTSKVNWLAQATEVDEVKFLHDTVDNTSFRKKSMDELYDVIANCEKDCIWNSQYGSLTPEAQNAIENVIKKNSAIYRFIDQELSQPNNRVTPNQKANKILALIKSNRSYMAMKLENELIPVSEVKADIDVIADQFINLFKKSSNAKSKINEARRLLKSNLDSSKAYKDFARALSKVAEENKKLLVSEVDLNADNVEKSLHAMRGFVDMDPDGLLKPHQMINFHFMTNDVNSWTVGADKAIHSDFHHNMMTKFRKMGPGLHVYGLNSGGRIHSKVASTQHRLVVSSMNADPRSEKFNTEVGVLIETRYKGQELNEEFRQHIFSYMLSQKKYIDGNTGKMIQPKQCFDLMTTIARKIMAPIL